MATGDAWATDVVRPIFEAEHYSKAVPPLPPSSRAPAARSRGGGWSTPRPAPPGAGSAPPLTRDARAQIGVALFFVTYIMLVSIALLNVPPHHTTPSRPLLFQRGRQSPSHLLTFPLRIPVPY